MDRACVYLLHVRGGAVVRAIPLLHGPGTAPASYAEERQKGSEDEGPEDSSNLLSVVVEPSAHHAAYDLAGGALRSNRTGRGPMGC